MENWKKVSVNENYSISSMGRLVNNKTGRFLKYRIKRGYSIISLKSGESMKTFFVHRIVAMAFLPNPENKPQVNHKNRIKNDNRLVNLEWCTASYNMRHLFKSYPVRKFTMTEINMMYQELKYDIA